VSWSEAWMMSYKDREGFVKVINKLNQQKSGKPSSNVPLGQGSIPG